jgi:plasmid stability protein
VVTRDGEPMLLAVPLGSRGLDRPDVRTELAVRLLDHEQISLGVAARIAGLPIADLIGGSMATLTIRNLEEPLKTRLRVRAAARNRSMEEEARQILRAALQELAPSMPDLGTRVRARLAALGDVQLPVEARDPVRPPPAFEGPAVRTVGERKVGRPSGRRR